MLRIISKILMDPNTFHDPGWDQSTLETELKLLFLLSILILFKKVSDKRKKYSKIKNNQTLVCPCLVLMKLFFTPFDNICSKY